jgi:dihydroneopterin aldolase/2-amino-4-hydroxy-6-hydroxymethyldihydropteridine diphosphokinase
MGADTIILRGLRIRGYHGVFDEERERGQDFVVDALLTVDTRRAARTDDVGDTVHYGVLAEQLAAIVAGEPVALLETLAARLADACLADARVARVEIVVHKPQAPLGLAFDDVEVRIRRARGSVVLALGSNLGDRLAHLQAAARALAGLAPLRASGVWETDPVGGPEQGPYLNAVVVLAPSPALPADPLALLDLTQSLELMRDRERRERWGPRTLDIDIVAVGAGTLATDRLVLPHPRASERAFVLLPWLEVEPDAVLPGAGPIADLAADLVADAAGPNSSGVVCTDLPLLP